MQRDRGGVKAITPLSHHSGGARLEQTLLPAPGKQPSMLSAHRCKRWMHEETITADVATAQVAMFQDQGPAG